MDSNNLLKKSQQNERPIILSPPSLERQSLVNNSHPFNQERQHSVGYNLQHEFETLKADLDLDLEEKGENLTPSYNATSTGLEYNSLAPSASRYGFSSDIINSMPSNSLLGENNISKITSNPALSNSIGSLLNPTHGSGFLPPPAASIPNRPQSVNDFSNFFNNSQPQSQSQFQTPQNPQQSQPHQSTFYSDLLIFSNWIENLSPQDSLTMIEHLCNNLPFDILLAFKTKLDGRLAHPSNTVQKQPNSYSILSPLQQQTSHELFNDMDSLNLNEHRPAMEQHQIHHPKPKPNSFKSSHYLFADQKNQRPKSADPSLNNSRFTNNQQQSHLERARSPTTHLFEKTNFLQLAAANSNSPMQQNQNPQNGNSEESADLSAHAALKLGALATINSRVALDSNRKNFSHNYGGNYFQQQLPQNRYHSAANISATEDSINRIGNSSSVPVSIQRNTNLSSARSPPNNGKNKKVFSPDQNSNDATIEEAGQQISSNSQASSTSNSSMPADISNPDLLNNIPAWLKLLRLHKYTESLKDIPWKELIQLNDQQLEERGVKALGARRKLLKAFEVVKRSL